MRRASVVAVLAFLVLPAFAQFSERLEVRVHEIDVVVETRDGKPVMSLGKDDLIVLEDGAPQQITNFSIVNESTATASAAAKPAVVQTAQPTASARKPRKFIFFMDEFGMHDQTRRDLLRQASDIIGVMRSDDEAMVITPASPERIPLFFTSDTDALTATLDRVTSQMMRKGDVRALGSEVFGGGETLRRGDCGQSLGKCAEERLADLRSIVQSLGQLSGRKVLVLMTSTMSTVPGFSLSMPSAVTKDVFDSLRRPGIVGDFRNLQRLTKEVARIAAESSVTIYGLEPYEPGDAALADGLMQATAGAPLKPAAQRGAPGTQDLLLTLADTTGGKAFSGTKEAPLMFEQMSRDLSSYYSLAYRDSDTKRSDHSVEVTLRNHPELVVRARRGVRAFTTEEEQRGLALAAVLSSQSRNRLGIRLTASPLRRTGRLVDVPVHVHVPLSRLTFTDQGGNHHAQFKVLVAAVGDHGDFGTSQVEHAQDVIVPHSRWDAAQTEGFVFDTTLRVSPGHYRVAVGATDTTSGETGFQTFTVDAK